MRWWTEDKKDEFCVGGGEGGLWRCRGGRVEIERDNESEVKSAIYFMTNRERPFVYIVLEGEGETREDC